MNDWILLGLIVFGTVTIGTVISLFMFVKLFYNDRALIIEEDSGGHMLPPISMKLRRIKKEDQFHLAFFNRFFWNYSVLDKFKPMTEFKGRLYLLFRDNRGFLHDFRLDKDTVKEVYKVKCIPTDVFAAQQALLHNLHLKYNEGSWWNRHGTVLMGTSFGILLLFAIIYQWQQIQELGSKNLAVVDKCFAGCKSLWNSTQQNMTAFKVVR